MGTNSPENCPNETMGIIPRAIRDMFCTVREREDEYQYLVKCSFVELYAENLYDLLAPGPRDDNILDIREGVGGEIRMQGVTEVPVASLQETMRCLEQGSHHRATGSTAMNAQSSRSHALFCVTLQQWKKQNRPPTDLSLVWFEGHKLVLGFAIHVEEIKSKEDLLRELGECKSQWDDEKQELQYRTEDLTTQLSVVTQKVETLSSQLRDLERKKHAELQEALNIDEATHMEAFRNKDENHEAEILKITTQHQEELKNLESSWESRVAEKTKHLQAQHSKLFEEHQGQEEAYRVRVSELLSDVTNLQLEKKAAEEQHKASLSSISADCEKTRAHSKVATAREKMDEKLNELQARMDSTVQDLNDTIKSSDSAVAPVLASKLELIKQVQQQVADLQTMHRENEEQLVSHELTHHQAADISAEEDEHQQPSNGDGSSSPRDKSQDESASPAADCSVASALMRSQKGQELASLNHALAQKEELMRKMLSNDKDIANIRSSYERAIQELQERISTVEHEKESLQQQIVSAPSNPASKLAEQRRERVQELTQEINDLKQKVIERNKALEMKEMSEKRVEPLSNEIQAMKQARVKLICQMKEDNDKFKRAQQLKNKEVSMSYKLTKVEQQLQHNDLSEEFRTELLNKQKDLSRDLQLRTAQINELQQKVLEGDGESLLERKRFEGLQGMSETKAALTMLFNTAVQHKAQCASSQQELQELQAQYKELVVASEETEAMLEEIKAAHEQQIMKLENAHENKVSCLLRQKLSSDQE
ncbi:chromosome-associated kinesin KIF4-like, partial [Hyalella azteca]|uniref:Chromosome-associated kinesin KIF4-like n=1 Tax=Hyalella azteca TaxID=294128 RepID=A0A8B7P3F4_HYAAZ